MKNKHWHIVFKKVDPVSGDVHRLFEKHIVIEDDKHSGVFKKATQTEAIYAYTCHDRLGKQKSLLNLHSQSSAQKHVVKKTGIDPFEEVIVEDEKERK